MRVEGTSVADAAADNAMHHHTTRSGGGNHSWGIQNIKKKKTKQATRLLCQLSAPAGQADEREGERKEAAEQAERERGKGNRKSLLDANARFALVDAQEAAAIEQIAWPPGRQSPDSRPPCPTPLPPPSYYATVVVCCGRAQLTFVCGGGGAMWQRGVKYEISDV